MNRCRKYFFLLLMVLFFNPCVLAAESRFVIEGSGLSLWWGLPFVLVVGSLALFPLVLPKLWHLHYGKIVSFYTLGVLIPLLFLKGGYETLCVFAGILLHHYLPFLLLIVALYITTGGVQISIQAPSSAKVNTLILGIATFAAGWIGTTGASMLFIRPFLKLNQNRLHRQHLVIFFIVLVGNVGGGLTPLGDPPLFLGYLEGIDFSWTFRNMTPLLIFLAIPLLIIFYVWDRRLQAPFLSEQKLSFRLQGSENLFYLGSIVLLVLMTGSWRSKISFTFLEISWTLENFIRDAGLVLIALISYFRTSLSVRKENNFGWAPLQEVTILFAAIFITVVPVLEMLKAGNQGPFHPWLRFLHQTHEMPSPALYFWVTGLLSSFLDNAPTYLVFFNLAGGDPSLLMTTLQPVLLAISAGSVFMGALTYIGNAPNFMIKSMAESHGIRMPSFFGYSMRVFLLLAPFLGLMPFFFFR